MNAKKYLLLPLILLASCTAKHLPITNTPEETSTPPLTFASPLAGGGAKETTVSSWDLRGAIAARNQSKGFTASISWLQQGPNSYQIRLFGPLGSGTILVSKNGGVITYQDGAKKFTSNNAGDLLKEQTGVRLPVENLYYWVRALKAPGAVSSTHYDENHFLTQIKQGGYTIDYARYTVENQQTLPSLIRLQGPGVVIKLVIKHWRV